MICVLVFLTRLDPGHFNWITELPLPCTGWPLLQNTLLFGKSTVHKCIHDVCTAMAENILDKYVKFPADDDLQHVIDGFDNTWGFPNCAGAVYGTHIPIIAQESAHGNYVNRKAVCDHNYIITDINVGWPGRVHDARVFRNSELYYKGEINDLFQQKKKKLVCPGKEIVMPTVLLGDAAYPLKTWLLKPYTNRTNLTAAQRMFNYRLSRARMTIESTFGRLKGRWPCLQKRLDVSVDFAGTVVTAYVLSCITYAKSDMRDTWMERGKKSMKSEMTAMVMGRKLNPMLSSLGTT